MKIGELNGFRLKKDLNAFIVRKRYHNKHKDGSGNFGFIIWFNDKDVYILDGDYDTNKNINKMWFVNLRISFDDALEFDSNTTYDELIKKIKKKVVLDGLGE